MDIENTKIIIKKIKDTSISIKEKQSDLPSPFAFNLMLQNYSDILKSEDRAEFLLRMHEKIVSQIDKQKNNSFSANNSISKEEKNKIINDIRAKSKKNHITYIQRRLLRQLSRLTLQTYLTNGIIDLIHNKEPDGDVLATIKKNQNQILDTWPKELAIFVLKECEKKFSYDQFWEKEESKEQLKVEELIETLRIDFLYAVKREELEYDIKEDILAQISSLDSKNKKLPSEKSRKWIIDLLSGTIHKKWTDPLVTFFQKQVKNQ